MTITVRNVADDVYARFVGQRSDAMLYHGIKFRDFLIDLLGVRPVYRTAINAAGEVVGAMPVMAVEGPQGTVLNSLPFFGSNGGVLAATPEAANSLIGDFNAMASEPGVAAATLIANPLDAANYSALVHDLTDSRIGQFTPLPADASDPDDIEAGLMALYHQKTRNMVRKAMKCVTRVQIDNDGFDFLRRVHIENMSVLGGVPKPDAFFNLIPKHFEPGIDFDLFVGEVDGESAAALLVFYFNETAEYYTPVVLAAARNSQALSLLIHRAMMKAIGHGCRWWNWGGTWSTQQGVYQFKSRWGTQDKPYTYYIRLANRELLNSRREDLMREYPFTYVVPFDALRKNVVSHA